MSEESIHDIIREMMNCTAVKSKVPHSTVEDILNPPIIRFNLEQRTIVRDFACRIEAAAERARKEIRRDAEIEWTRIGYDERKAEEKHAPGNAAAMREALEAARREARDSYDGGEYLGEGADPGFLRILAIIDAALAEPARNCDRFATAEDAWMAFKRKNDDAYFDTPSLNRFKDWLFAPAEGGAK